MQIGTTDLGLQVYTANHLPNPDVHGLDGRHYARHAGIALEAQLWPDAPNQPGFPSAAFAASDVYRQEMRYVFSKGRHSR